MTVVEDLEKHVVHVRVSLLDLVQEDEAIGLATNHVGKLAGVLVAHVARRGADEPGDVVLLHKLGHVQLEHRLFVAEHELGEDTGEERLAHTGGSQEHEHADGAAWVLKPGAGTPHGLGDIVDRLVLTHYPLVQRVLHVEQPLRLLGGDTRDRDAGPHRNDLADVFLRHNRLGLFSLRLPARLHPLQLILEAHLAVTELGGELVLLGGDRLLLLTPQALQPLARLLQRRRGVGALDAHP